MTYYDAASSVSRNVQAMMDENYLLYVASDNGLRLMINTYTEDNSNARVDIPQHKIRCVLPNGAILLCEGFMYPGNLYRVDAVDQRNHAHFWVEVRCFND